MDSPCSEEDNTTVPNKVPNNTYYFFECCHCRDHYIYSDKAKKSGCPKCGHRSKDCCRVVDSGIAKATSHSKQTKETMGIAETEMEERDVETNTNESEVETNEDEKDGVSNNIAQSSPVTLTPSSPTTVPETVPLIEDASTGIVDIGDIIEAARGRSVVERGLIHTVSPGLVDESESEEQKGQLESIKQPQDQQKLDHAGTIPQSKGVIPSSHAFKEFIRNLVDEVDPLFKHKIRRLAHWYLVKQADPDIQADLLELISELAYSDPVTIHIYNEDSISWVDKIGNLLDGYSKDEWDWWPLATPKQRLMPGYSRLDWKCVSTKVMYPNVRF